MDNDRFFAANSQKSINQPTGHFRNVVVVPTIIIRVLRKARGFSGQKEQSLHEFENFIDRIKVARTRRREDDRR